MQPLALVVDDEPDICELLTLTLQRMDVRCHTAATLEQARRLLAEHRYHFCLTDMRLPDGDGLELVERIQRDLDGQLPIAVITAHGNTDTAINALKLGAFDFVSKPVDLERLRGLVQLALRLNRERDDQSATSAPRLLLGEAPAMRKLRAQIAKVARSDAPIYISGESGSGKELAARSIHLQGPRAEQPFVAVNCGAIPTELMESEFFGHKKGSFTGAHRDKPGLFQSAAGGTLFLDEVADLPLPMQVKLLRTIQEKAVRPIGAGQEVPVDVRILCATHKDLSQEVIEGRFRNDLYYRINVIEIQVPALRERAGDIPLLADTILRRIARAAGSPPPELAPAALGALQRYRFPGNVRQLENILERAFTLCDEGLIREEDLNLEQDAGPSSAVNPVSRSPRAEAIADSHEQYRGQFETGHYGSLDEFLESIERQTIESTLQETRWNRTAAAQKLGISFRSLRYRLKKLGLED
ncbi:Transcriptional regulatory protein ZraR [Microbulbifer aggregans]|uniref:Transcriptional regulatory protein ZraR n=1 Tax=Microbulbifer aggregans TaxID=1769779 RepID=A0A1C9W6W2_9GAMM|nr:sigma-54 dependent transcriptional regulator [Microbulbifer aggregans]AOS96894.1 Transcriptional regulatory protein ZraR [Microbulbifer aggregans]